MISPIKSLTVLAAVAVAATLAGCAVPAHQGYARAQPVNPYEWHTVSVTPVAPGSRAGEASPARVEYTTGPVYPASSVYVAPPLYAPAPAYYYPPVTIGLDFVFGNWGHRHRYGHRR
jgi:hypothetical protein